MSRHLIIPDTQIKAGVPTVHMDWVGWAIQEYEPDSVIHLGDHWDMSSISRWSAKGSKDKEGARILDDIEAGNKALTRLSKAMGDYVPKNQIILRGNHEQRLLDYVSANPEVEGIIGHHLFNDVQHGWKPIEYFHGSPNAIELDGIQYAHYFANPNTGKPIAGTIQNRLAKIGSSFVQGHSQGLLQGNMQYATGFIRHGIVAGSCYLHDEEYKGMANSHWRGIVVLNEVKKGEFCEMPLSLNYLCGKYEGVSLNRYMNKNYKNAKERFSIANT